MPDSVADRLRAILAGDRVAAAWLYDSFGPRLHRRLSLRYGYPGGLDVDDLFHDAFVLFFRNQGRLLAEFLTRTPAEECTEKTLAKFLWDQACGLASNRRRSAAYRRVVAISEIHDPVADSDQERTTVDRDTLGRMIDCLGQKSQRVYLYFVLRFVDGLSPEEIAQTTGWSQKATYKLRQTLSRTVEECAERLGIAAG